MPFTHPKRNIITLALEPGQRVADLGAGSGHYTFAAADMVGGGGKVYAVDVQKNLISKIKSESLRRNLGNIEVVWGNIEKERGTTLKDESVHIVLLTNTLFQVEDKEAVVREAFRILRPKGKLLVIDWSESFGGLGPNPAHVIDERTAKDLIEDTGFKIEQEIEAGAHHYGFIARKS